MQSRSQKAKFNIISSIALQIVTLMSGLIIPQLLIRTFGSTVYGLTTSITHFLAFITLLEGGISGVARAAFYKPLAEKDKNAINGVYSEINSFFIKVGYAFILYTFILAFSFNYISGSKDFDWFFSFILVIVISLSTLAQYFFGISNSVLIQSDQKLYIINFVSIISQFLNVALVIVLVRSGCGIVVVKFISSLVFFVRPIALMIYAKRSYKIEYKKPQRGSRYLTQKVTALGQHIAYFLHTNTDVAVLTIFTNLKSVAVYSIYNMIVTSVRGLVSSFTSGMESVLGSFYAMNDKKGLQNVFESYETMLSIVATVVFSATITLILPFVRIYTNGLNDANYIQPVFAIAIVLSELVYCIRTPYHYMINAAGHFRQTKFAAYGEAIINIIGSIALVKLFGLAGVAIATCIATIFRTLYYVWYLSKNIMNKSINSFIKRQLFNAATICINVAIGNSILLSAEINSYIRWIQYAFIISTLAGVVSVVINSFFYRDSIKVVTRKIFRR